MHAVLNELFTLRHLRCRGEAPTQILSIFRKIKGLLFFRFDDCGQFEGGPGANVSNAFFLNSTLL